MKKFTIGVLLVLVVNILMAQDNRFVLGIVLNQNTKKPIPFASVYWKESNMGVVTNEDGSFKLPINKSGSEKTLIISCIGYQTIEKSINEINPNRLTTYYLIEKVFDIDEIVIKEKKLRIPSARQIVKKAIENIANNHPLYPFLLEGYYRDYMLIDGKYVNLFESLIELEDKGFHVSDYENTLIKQIYGRINNDFSYDTTKIMNYSDESLKRLPSAEIRFEGGNEMSLLRLTNPIRNYDKNTIDFINVFKTDFLENHYCQIYEAIIENNKLIYAIHFKYYDKDKKKETALEKALINKKHEVVEGFQRIRTYKRSTQEFEAEGMIYIDRETYAIKKLSYKLFLDDQKYDKVKGWELNLEYKQYQDKSYLHYISYNNIFEMPNYNDSVYFYLKNTMVDKRNHKIVLEFNNEIRNLPKKNVKEIKILFKNKKVDFSLARKDSNNGKQLYLIFEENKFKRFFSDFNKATASHLAVKLSNKLTDVNGNKIYDAETILGYQYREFFVNKIKTVFVPLLEEECIDKWESLFENKSLDIDNSKEVFLNSPLLK